MDIKLNIMLILTEMIKLETINYQDRINDSAFISKCLAGRESEVTLYVSKDSQILFSVKTKKTNREDYVSVTIRNENNFLGLMNHIESEYGGYIIPVLKKMSLKKNLEGSGKEYQDYLNGLFNHRIIRADSVLFMFCFIQEKEEIGESKYERYLHKALDLSRKHLSRLLTRENHQQHTEKDESLEVYRLEAIVKKNHFQKIALSVNSINQQCESLYNIFAIINSQKQFQSPYAISLQLKSKCQKIRATFQEIEEAYHRRVLLLERIKQLKAENIRHKYNSRNQSNEKLLEAERNKHVKWSQILVQQMECTLVVLDSLIKEIISKLLAIQRMMYEKQESS